MKSLINKSNKGFTLIELLVVIGILSILVVGLMVAINPQDKLNAARDSRIISDMGAVSRASEAYATSNNGFYPATVANLVPSELKVAPSTSASWTVTNTPAGCTAGSTCTAIAFVAPLTSNKYITQSGCTAATTWYRFNSSTGSACATCAANATAALTSSCLLNQ